MKRPVKILAWGVGAIVVLLALAAVGLKLYVTKERILAWVVPRLEAELDRSVTIADAGAGLTGVRLEGLDVRAEGAAEPLLSAGLIRVRWDLWALLRGTVQVNEVRLVEPRIRVVRLPDGALDIDDLLATRDDAPERAPAAAPGDARPRREGLGLVVALFSLENGRVTFEDQGQSPPRVYVLDAIDSRVSDFALDRPVPFTLTARLPLAEAGRFSADGTLDAAAGDVRAKVRVADFDLPSLNPLLEEGGLRFESGSFGLDLDLEVSDGAHVTVQGTAGARRMTLASGSQTGGAADLAIQVDAGADLSGGTAELRRLELQVADQKLRAEATVRGLNARPRVDFRLTSEELRVDPLTALLPSGEPGAPAAPPAGKPEPAPSPAPASIPLDAFGDVRVGRLRAGGAVVEDFQARIELDKGVLQVKPAGAGLYGGTLQLTTRAELEKRGPPFEAGVELAGTQLSQILAAVRPALRDTATGTLGLSLQARGLGGDLGALRSQVKAEAKDGKILNHPLAANLAALLQVKELETLNFYSVRADVETAEGKGQVKSVVFSGPNLQASATGTFGLVDGALDLRLAVALPKELAARLVRESTTLDAVTDAEGWSRLPLRLRGTLESPSYGLDAEGLREAAAKALGGKAEKFLEEKVLDRLPVGEEGKGQLQEGLRRLLGR